MNLAADEETNRLLSEITRLLCDRYSVTEAESLVRDYYIKFTDPSYCESIGIPAQDDDFFFHEGALGMALRILYYLGLRGNPDPEAFIEWRTNYLRRA